MVRTLNSREEDKGKEKSQPSTRLSPFVCLAPEGMLFDFYTHVYEYTHLLHKLLSYIMIILAIFTLFRFYIF